MNFLLAILLTGATSCVVARVVDGDTLVCKDGRYIRLLQIDAPEKKQPDGPAAKAGLEWLVSEHTVRLEFDKRKTDKYGRTLAYVWLDQLLVNEELARQGLVTLLSYAGGVKYLERIQLAIDEARHYKRGIWKNEKFCSPADFRRRLCQ